MGKLLVVHSIQKFSTAWLNEVSTERVRDDPVWLTTLNHALVVPRQMLPVALTALHEVRVQPTSVLVMNVPTDSAIVPGSSLL